MSPKNVSAPLVVIAVVSEKTQANVISAMKSIGKQWRAGEKAGQRDIAFTWMDGERWSKWLKSMYGIVDAGAGSPSVIVADHAVCSSYSTFHGKDAWRLRTNHPESCLLRR